MMKTYKVVGIIAVLAMLGAAIIAENCLADEGSEDAQGRIPLSSLPPEVKEAVEMAYPNCRLREASVEAADGENLYEVGIVYGRAEYDVKVTAKGRIIEFEEEIDVRRLPKAVRDTLAKEYADASILEVEMSVSFTRITYEGEFIVKGSELAVEVDTDGRLVDKGAEGEGRGKGTSVRKLPDRVKEAVKAAYPGGKLRQASVQAAGGDNVYEVEVGAGRREYEMKITSEGMIRRLKEEIDVRDLPESIRQALKGAYPEGSLRSAAKITHDPIITYEIELTSGDKEWEIELNISGHITKLEEAD